ncbi:MAG: hypothetical protein E6R03_15925 [Hyphomicrobiaceae bacterium]|nr:MAG: hypothetical protein E6R03_15925 [Hyphomicrobiaceae bacterium]
MPEYVTLAVNYGLPTVILAFTGWAIWTAAKWIAHLAETKVIPAFLDMRDAMADMQQDFREFLGHVKVVDKIANRVEDLHEKIDRIPCCLEKQNEYRKTRIEDK